jgi:hypothetical protein
VKSLILVVPVLLLLAAPFVFGLLDPTGLPRIVRPGLLSRRRTGASSVRPWLRVALAAAWGLAVLAGAWALAST